MSSLNKDRRSARELALDVLYQAEITGQLPSEALALQREQGWSVTLPEENLRQDGTPTEGALSYAITLIQGIQAHLAQIDGLLDRYAQRWSIERMAVVDRNLLRLGVYELLWSEDVPTAVAINEAIELAKRFSTEESGRFINGLLGQIASAESQDAG